MKNFIITTCAILMVSLTANACGGITITGKSGATYCLSKHRMNWYSAYAWCEAQGMSLIDLKTVCKSNTSCSELALSSEGEAYITSNGGECASSWIKESATSSIAFYISLYSGVVFGTGNGRRTSTSAALCF